MFVEVTPYPDANPFFRFLENHTLIYPLIKNGLGVKREAKENEELITLMFKALQDTSREVGAHLVILCVPLSDDIRFTRRSLFYQYLMDSLTKSGYSVVDPYERLVSFSRKQNLYFFKSGKHWTVAGHRVVAESLYDFVTQKGFH